jgi:hypothetical protein
VFDFFIHFDLLLLVADASLSDAAALSVSEIAESCIRIDNRPQISRRNFEPKQHPYMKLAAMELNLSADFWLNPSGAAKGTPRAMVFP